MVISPKGEGYICSDEYCPNHKKIEEIVCENCGERNATMEWVGEGGALAWSHGWSSNWCELCCVREQLAYAVKQAERIPELEEELERLENEDSSSD